MNSIIIICLFSPPGGWIRVGLYMPAILTNHLHSCCWVHALMPCKCSEHYVDVHYWHIFTHVCVFSTGVHWASIFIHCNHMSRCPLLVYWKSAPDDV